LAVQKISERISKFKSINNNFMKYFTAQKVILFSLLIFFAFSNINQSYGQFIYGIKAGYGINTLKGSDLYGGINYRKSFTGGLVLGYKFRTDFCFQGELLYNPAGMNQKFIQINRTQFFDQATGHLISNDSTFKFNNNLKLNYITVPLLFKKSFSFKAGIGPFQRNSSVIDFDIFVGPYVSYLLGAQADFDTKVSIVVTDNGVVNSTEAEKPMNDAEHNSFKTGQKNTYSRVGDTLNLPSTAYLMAFAKRAGLKDGLSKLDVGLTAGLGLSIELSANSKLTFDARFSKGFLSIDKEYFSDINFEFAPGGSIPTGLPPGAKVSKKITKKNITNQAINIFVGYVIYLK
jgi:hypothetical protein